MTKRSHTFEAAEIVLPCPELEATVAFFCDVLGFRIAEVVPADEPTVTVVAGHGIRLRLDSAFSGSPGRLRLLFRDVRRDPSAVANGGSELMAPNGTIVELAAAAPPVVMPALAPEFTLTRLVGNEQEDAQWVTGRAGMRYRDLVPGRQGGRFIASHIQIPSGGPVPDYVHHHNVRFQLIYCYRGWVRVVYEDQGPPIVLKPGDCILQAPHIRHQVLECSPGLEVIELGSPAKHETYADLELELPTATLRPDRDFGGQRFVFHRADTATWKPLESTDFDACDLGIAAATDGLVLLQALRAAGADSLVRRRHHGELRFTFMLRGTACLERDGHVDEALRSGDAFVIPPDEAYSLRSCSHDLELLELVAGDRSALV